jgi:signal transduction histidine kinase
VERPTAWERLRRVNPLVADGLLAAVVCGLALLLEITYLDPGAFCSDEAGHAVPCHGIDALGRVLVAATCAPLVWRRRWPIGVLAACAIGIVALHLRDYPTDFAGLAFVIAVYSAAAHVGRAGMLTLALPIAVGAALTIFLVNPPSDRSWAEILFDVGSLLGLPTLFGRIEFNRRRRIARDSERAASDAVGEERARIARELHDVVAHAMSVMVVQAGAARTVLDRDPAEAASALRRIEDTGRMGLAEMRRLLGILETDHDEVAALVPQPGLEQPDELLERMRGTGLPVEAMVEGTPRDLPPGIDLTAFRVVQEGLTNALRHAGGAHARVLLRYDDEALEVEVADDGQGPPPDGTQTPGHGLIGMHERVALFGGSLDTGTRSGGGFVVRARLPLVDSK